MGFVNRLDTRGLTVVDFFAATLPDFFETTYPRPVLLLLSGFIPMKRLKNDSVFTAYKVELFN